jgi:archaellum component FlaC
MDWQAIDIKMNNALAAIKLDSLEKVYTVILNQLNKVTSETKTEVNICPLPDQSIEQIQETKEELSNRVNIIKALRSDKKVVRL